LCRFAFHDQPCAQCRLRHAGSTKKSASAGSVVASNAARRFDSTCSSHLMKGGNHDEGGNPDEGGNHELARRFDSTCSSHLMKGGNHDEGGNHELARRFDSTCSSHLMKGGNHDEGGNPDEGGNHELPPDEVVAIMMREAIMSLNQWQLSLEVVDAAAIIRVAVGHAELPKLVHVHAQRPR